MPHQRTGPRGAGAHVSTIDVRFPTRFGSVGAKKDGVRLMARPIQAGYGARLSVAWKALGLDDRPHVAKKIDRQPFFRRYRQRNAVAAQQLQRNTALAASERFAMQAIRAAESGRLEEALRRVVDAETVALNTPWGSYARGMLARIANDHVAAAAMFRSALAIDPDHASSKTALAETLAKIRDLESAPPPILD